MGRLFSFIPPCRSGSGYEGNNDDLTISVVLTGGAKSKAEKFEVECLCEPGTEILTKFSNTSTVDCKAFKDCK